MNLYDDEKIGVREFDTVIVEHNTGISNIICAGFLIYGNIMGIEKLYFQNVIILTTNQKLKEFRDFSSAGGRITVRVTKMVLTEKTKKWTRVIGDR